MFSQKVIRCHIDDRIEQRETAVDSQKHSKLRIIQLREKIEALELQIKQNELRIHNTTRLIEELDKISHIRWVDNPVY